MPVTQYQIPIAIDTDNSQGRSWDYLVINAPAPDPNNIASWNGHSGNFLVRADSTEGAVPEPGTFCVVAGALALVEVVRRRASLNQRNRGNTVI